MISTSMNMEENSKVIRRQCDASDIKWKIFQSFYVRVGVIRLFLAVESPGPDRRP